MSLTEFRTSGQEVARRKTTAESLLKKKQEHSPITSLTAYDYPTARLVDDAGVDLILVGDSLGMAVLGYDSTLPVTMDDMLHHAKAARRGTQYAMLVVDMPYGSYQVSDEETVRNALRLVKEAGAEAVKLEGGSEQATQVERLTRAGIPVVGHIGLTPQSVLRMGGYRVQGKSIAAIDKLLEDAAALEGAGAIAIVLEGIPREVAERITAAVTIPTIGIGAGPGCDGQILVFHDLFNLTFAPAAKFVRRYGDAAELVREGIESYRNDVQQHSFPADEESYHLSRQILEQVEHEKATPCAS